MSRRADLWDTFAHAVRCHINDYTVPQYGDAPGDLLESMSVDECVHQIRKYAQRHGRNSRDGQDERRDEGKAAPLEAPSDQASRGRAALKQERRVSNAE